LKINLQHKVSTSLCYLNRFTFLFTALWLVGLEYKMGENSGGLRVGVPDDVIILRQP